MAAGPTSGRLLALWPASQPARAHQLDCARQIQGIARCIFNQIKSDQMRWPVAEELVEWAWRAGWKWWFRAGESQSVGGGLGSARLGWPALLIRAVEPLARSSAPAPAHCEAIEIQGAVGDNESGVGSHARADTDCLNVERERERAHRESPSQVGPKTLAGADFGGRRAVELAQQWQLGGQFVFLAAGEANRWAAGQQARVSPGERALASSGQCLCLPKARQ